MKNTINLTKIYFKQLIMHTFTGGNIHKRKVNAKQASSIGIILLVVGILLAAISFQLYSFAKAFIAMGAPPERVLLLGLILVSVMVLFLLIYEIQGYFFKNKDFELLSSMPIKTGEVVSAKLISMLLTAYVYQAIVYVPLLIVYYMFASFSFLGFVYLVTSFLFMPFLFIMLGILFSVLITFISSKFKHNNLINIILMFIGVAVLMIIFGFGQVLLIDILAAPKVPTVIKAVFPTAFLLYESVATGGFVSYLLFMLMSLACMGISIWVVNFTYYKINVNLKTVKGTVCKKEITYKQNKIFKSLLKSEAKRFLSIPLYVMNSVIGLVLAIFSTIGLSVLASGDLMKLLEGQGLGSFMGGIIIMLLCFFVTLAPTTNSTISIEGTRIYNNVKALPVSFKQFVLPKIIFNLLLNIPVILICSTIFVIVMPFDAITAILVYIVPVIASVAATVFALLINLRFPKLNWSSALQVVKQSASVLINILLFMPLIMGTMALYYIVFVDMLHWNAIGLPLIYLAEFLIIGGISIGLLITKGEKLYKQL